jgi:hypothetical protein
MKRRIVVVGDRLSRGGYVLPYEQPMGFRFSGHMAALIGGEVYCESCKSCGFIVKAGGPKRLHYMSKHEVALDHELIACQCATPPHIVAELAGEAWCDDGAAEHTSTATNNIASRDDSTSAAFNYSEQFVLFDAHTSHPLSAVRYRIRTASGRLFEGVTDGHGKTARVSTSAAEPLVLEIR